VLHAGDNRWKLADFGIARMPDSDLTQVGIFMGTPGYSPPEAIREGRYTPQADVFAWGAVFYELLSGRIPYEGPDTKTTNSYVVQGQAPPPSRYDTSIPEPLATVTMTALQPSDRARFKDSSEAEQALREGWDRCLTQGLVHPAVLAMEETPHDKVPPRMHEIRGAVARASVPMVASDSNELTAIDDKMLARPLAIESRKPARDGDDDPTVLSVREEERRGKADGAGRSEKPERTYPDGSGPRGRVEDAPRTEKDPSRIEPIGDARSASSERLRSKLPLVIVLVMVALAALVGGLFVGGVIKI